MKQQGKACRKDLTKLGVKWRSARRKRNIATPVVVPNMSFGGLILEPKFRKPPFVMDCHLARSLAEAGPAMVAAGVAKLRFSSIHSFRRVRGNGRVKRSLSRHAYGLAVDIYEVDPVDGQRLVINSDYVRIREGDPTQDTPATLLHDIEREGNASGQFRLLLTPGNDPKSHYDHFHLEAKVEALALTVKQKRRERRARKRARMRRKRKNRK